MRTSAKTGQTSPVIYKRAEDNTSHTGQPPRILLACDTVCAYISLPDEDRERRVIVLDQLDKDIIKFDRLNKDMIMAL